MISSEKEMYTVKKQMNRIFRVLLTLVILLGLLPGAAAAAGAAEHISGFGECGGEICFRSIQQHTVG